MALISVQHGTILSSTQPDTVATDYPVAKILNGDTGQTGGPGGWQYYKTNGAALTFPIYAIVNLGKERPVDEFKVYGLSYIWGGGSCPKEFTISVAPSTKNGGSPKENDFTILTSATLPSPTRPYSGRIWANELRIAVTPQMAQYVRISIDSIYDPAEVWMGLGEFEIYGQSTLPTLTTILSDAEIAAAPNLVQVTSDAFVDATKIKVVTPEIETIKSDARIVANMATINSSAVIVDPGQNIYSNATISGKETTTKTSDAHIKRTESSVRPGRLAFPGRGSWEFSPDHVPGTVIKNAFVKSTLSSTSLETIVPDMFTGTVLDLNECNPPFGYQNYDWSYDWVARTFHAAQYCVETRSGFTLEEVEAAVFSVTPRGHRLYRGNIPRYHQYRLHVWASGSGDFEFHQFTLRGHVSNTGAGTARGLIRPPFLTTNTINMTVPRTWEPNLEKAGIWTESYIPGDINNDGKVTGADVVYLNNWLFAGGPAPVDLRTADVDGDGVVDIGDVTYLSNYLSGSGPPPRIRLS